MVTRGMSVRECEPGQYIAYLLRIDGPATQEATAKGRYRSDYIFDAIALDAAKDPDIALVEPSKRPLLRLKTTSHHFDRLAGHEAKPGDWFLIKIEKRYEGSWVWAAIEDAAAPTGFSSAGDFSATEIDYLDPELRLGKVKDQQIISSFLAIKDASRLKPSTQNRTFSRLKKAMGKASNLCVEVVDVGQASFICVRDDNVSYIYFDVGLPLWFNAKSMPRGGVCYRPPYKKAVVVLSHWDFDHYSALYKHPDLAELNCIAPSEDQGPNSSKFAKQMGKRLWPLPHGHKVNLPRVRLRWATGNDRNNRGIVGIVQLADDKILLTGDAGYQHVAPHYKSGLTGVSVPHHASAYSEGTVPAPIGKGLAVISAGTPNKYGHPSVTAISAHNKWAISVSGKYAGYTRGNKIFW